MLIFYLLVLTGFVPLPRSLVRFKLPNRSFQYSVTFKHYSYASNSDTKNTIFHKDDNISFKDLIRTSKQRRDFTQALKLADHMSSNLQSISTANITGIIQVYGEAGKLGDAVNILRKMELLKMAPNEYHLSALIQACRKVGQWEMALGLYERLPMYGIKENHVISNCMLSTLIEASQYSVAYEIFDRMKMLGIHSVFSYSILMSAFEREGKWEKAIEVYEGMGRDNIQPNTVIFNSVLKACLRHGQFQRVFDLFNKSSSRVPSDAITYSLVITALGQLGDFNAAYKLFQSLVQYQPTTPKPSVVSVDGQTPVAAPVLDTGVYNAMLVVCSKVGRWQECLSIINQLKPPSMIRADARSFATVISCCGKALRWRDALDLYHQLSVQGIKKDDVVYYSIISTLQTAINNLILREARSEASGRSSPRVSSTPSSSQVQVNVNGSVAVGASPDPLFGVTSTELAVTLEKILEEANQHQSSSNRRSSEQEGR